MNDIITAGVRLFDIPYHADKIYDYAVQKCPNGCYHGRQNQDVDDTARPDDDALLRGISPGRLAIVPFGSGNRGRIAVICTVSRGDTPEKNKNGGDETQENSETGCTEPKNTQTKLKNIISLVSEELTLNGEMMKLAEFLSEHTFCSFGDAVKAMLPTSNLGKIEDIYSPIFASEEIKSGLSPRERELYDIILSSERISENGIIKKTSLNENSKFNIHAADLNDAVRRALSELVKRGAVIRQASFDEKPNRAYIRKVCLCDRDEADAYLRGEKKLKSAKQTEILSALCELYDIGKSSENDFVDRNNAAGTIDKIIGDGGTEITALEKNLNVTYSQIKSLCDKGLVKIIQSERMRMPYPLGEADRDAFLSKNIYLTKTDKTEAGTTSETAIQTENGAQSDSETLQNFKAKAGGLSSEQKKATDEIKKLLSSGKAEAALLFGVTGSGKTHIIKAAADEVIASGKQVIVLVPEIALTPQTVGFFYSYYGERIAVIHSSLSAGEKLDTWRRIRNGEVDICIGTRSAVFAPFSKLGMIVIDEEQEHTYKSDMNPKYHARDVARFRCAQNSALMLLASATPSLESYYKAKNGVYHLIELSGRYGSALMPEVRFADMRLDASEGNMSAVGSELSSEIARNKTENHQSILFINRRGYNNFVSCPMCGYVIKCPHCSVAMTLHTYYRDGKRGTYLACHYCGNRDTVPPKCPECGNEKLRFNGFGTQKVEEELKERFPQIRVSRMDADTTQTKLASDKILSDFRAGGADLLLGTQMVTKGHDFENVTLVGVLSADTSLYIDDYRANERTFSMLTQVAGRAGRGRYPGSAVVQTYNPDNPTLKFAAKQDYAAFYENEIKLRKLYTFPPFCDICLVTFTDTDEMAVQKAAVGFGERIKKCVKDKESGFSEVKLIMYGPFEAPIYRVNEKFRMRIVIKCKDNRLTRKLFSELLGEFSCGEYRNVSITLDMNPNNI